MRGDNFTGHEGMRMRHEEGMSLSEIAKALGVTRAGAYNAMRRARGGSLVDEEDLIEARRQREAKIDAQRVHRDPCVRCAVPADRHAEHGCRRFVHL